MRIFLQTISDYQTGKAGNGGITFTTIGTSRNFIFINFKASASTWLPNPPVSRKTSVKAIIM